MKIARKRWMKKKRSLRKFQKYPTSGNLDNYKKQYAKARRVMRNAMRMSWRDYVSRLNNRTPIKKAWEMVRKISGKCQYSGVKQLKVDDEYVTNNRDIANTLAASISENSSSDHY